MSAIDTVLGRSKVYVLLAGGLCWLWVWMLAGWTDVPTFQGDSVVLLATPGVLRAILVVIAGYAGALLIGNAVCLRWSKSAGWACGTFGLGAIAMRGGPLGEQLLGESASFFLLLAVETLLITALAGAAWWVCRRIVGVDRMPEGEPNVDKEPIDQKFLALATSTAACAVVVMFVARTDDKMQALMAAFLGGAAGAWVAHQFVETRPSGWFWAGPIVVAIVGYVAAWLSATDAALAIGEPVGFFAPLARVAPLHYASFGIAGGALGFAMSREKHALRRAEEHIPEPEPALEADPPPLVETQPVPSE